MLSAGACRQSPRTDTGRATAEPAGGKVEQRTSALTVLSRTGWVASASPAGGTGETADKAIDGTATSRWRSGVAQATNQFFQVDMAAARTFTEIRLDTTSTATEYPRSYKVQVANDNVSWATASTVVAGSGTAFMTLAFAPQTARYIRVTLTGGDTASWSIHEFNVYDASLVRTGWTATASTTATGTATAGALDSSITTRWSSASGTSHQFQVDMLATQTFDQITLDAGAATSANFPRSYTVSVSSDGTTFTQIASGTGTSRVVVVNFPMQQARFIRVNSTNGTAFTWSIEELYVGPATVATTYVRTGWTATAFTNSANAGLALDGSTTTSWTSTGGETSQFIQVDMQAIRMFTQVTVDAGTSVTPRTYQLQVGNTSTGPWTTVVSNVAGTAATVTISVAPQTSRFIKINQTATSTTNWSVRELNVSGPALSRAGWVVSASPSSTTDVPANAIDGTASTRWDSGANQAVTTPSQSFTLDMGAAHVVNQLTLDAGTSTGNYPRGYSVSLSNDGSNWGTPVATGTGSTQIVTINFLTQSARYISIAQTGTASANHWSIHEINVWRVKQPCDTVTCTASDQCHVAGVCDANTGVCSNPNKTNGSTCNDSNACTTGETCQNGTCGSGTTV
ncbi:MAG TPA: discoidin domain-containing protein, partial [Polyangia bacterium]|nr:discoidin domain-containing protein [Polyangia bacterium]